MMLHSSASPGAVFERKQCGDKVLLCFSQRKKKRKSGFDFASLESAECSVLSVIPDNTPSPHIIRYEVLVKNSLVGTTYTRVNVPDKFVLFAPLAQGDEVMVNFDKDTTCTINAESYGGVHLLRDSVGVVQACLESNAKDEGDSVYVMRLVVPGEAAGDVFWAICREIRYIKRCVEMQLQGQ